MRLAFKLSEEDPKEGHELSLKERLLLKWKKEKEEVEARRAKRKAEAEARIVNKLARIQRQFDQVRWTPRVAIRCACTTRRPVPRP